MAMESVGDIQTSCLKHNMDVNWTAKLLLINYKLIICIDQL